MVPKFTAVVSTPSLVMAVPFQQRLVGGLPPLEVVMASWMLLASVVVK